jgi:hypothetical protein
VKGNARERNTNADNVAADVEIRVPCSMVRCRCRWAGGGGGARLVEDRLRNLSEVRERRRGNVRTWRLMEPREEVPDGTERYHGGVEIVEQAD